MKNPTRRTFFAGALASLPFLRSKNVLSVTPTKKSMPMSMETGRRKTAMDIRRHAVDNHLHRVMATMKTNGDETALPSHIASYKKGFPQNRYGEVEPAAFNALLAAIKSQRFEDFEKIPRSGGRKQSNPQCSFAYQLEGGDTQTFDLPPAPSIRTAEATPDISELYWMSLCRDVPFSKFGTDPLIANAAGDLSRPLDRLFRGYTKGDSNGPIVSQFLLKKIPYSSGFIQQQYQSPVPKSDYMTIESEWAQISAGFLPWRFVEYDAEPRWIRNGRDLAEYVHYDFANQAFVGAAMVLVNSNAKSILNCNQFRSSNNPYRYSTIEDGFATFGPPEAADWLGRVTTAALKAAYYQKWCVHRRLRPEELGGLIHLNRTKQKTYPIHESLLNMKAVDLVVKANGSALLPQAYPEGCPLHPSYPAGHAAIAGACAVILKACFDGDMLLPDCLEPSEDGRKLQPAQGFFPTVGDEIDKLAVNIACGRAWAGIHYRSDNMAGLRLGEEVALSILQDLALTFSESFKGFTLKRFDGTRVHITPRGQLTTA